LKSNFEVEKVANEEPTAEKWLKAGKALKSVEKR
jgi:hypothetical protein